MLVTYWIKIQGPRNVNCPANLAYEIIKFIQGSQHDNKIVVVVKANQEISNPMRFIYYNYI